MKQIFVLAACVLLFACRDPIQGDKIDEIKISESFNGLCIHTMENGGVFYDSCGKFRVGDRINIQPK